MFALTSLTLSAVLLLLALGFFIAAGWAALMKLWALAGDRGQLIVAVIVVVVILVALVLAYRGG